MSSTVGYGVEVTGTAFGENVESGDFDMEVEERYSDLMVTRSRAEYGDEERVFVLLRNTVSKAGDDSTATVLNLHVGDTTELDKFLTDSGLDTDDPSWYLVDYYVYS